MLAVLAPPEMPLGPSAAMAPSASSAGLFSAPTITPLLPDEGVMAVHASAGDGPRMSSQALDAASRGFAALLDAVDGALDRAATSERAFAAGRGDLTSLVIARANADVALQVAATTSQHAAQSLATLFNLQL